MVWDLYNYDDLVSEEKVVDPSIVIAWHEKLRELGIFEDDPEVGNGGRSEEKGWHWRWPF